MAKAGAPSVEPSMLSTTGSRLDGDPGISSVSVPPGCACCPDGDTVEGDAVTFWIPALTGLAAAGGGTMDAVLRLAVVAVTAFVVARTVDVVEPVAALGAA